jgi:hypothetical protein
VKPYSLIGRTYVRIFVKRSIATVRWTRLDSSHASELLTVAEIAEMLSSTNKPCGT